MNKWKLILCHACGKRFKVNMDDCTVICPYCGKECEEII